MFILHKIKNDFRSKIIVSTVICSFISGCGGKSNNSQIANTNNDSSLDQGSFSVSASDKPFVDTTIYGSRSDDYVKDVTEGVAITHHVAVINGQKIKYTATVGHLVTIDPNSSIPNAKMFYVAFSADNKDAVKRPVTFLYNGGPGSSAVWLLLGSFSPKRIKVSMPSFTPPAPYTVEDNPDSLLDKTDLVFINPVGTGYSSAIYPSKNKDFWGVDQDAASITGFVKRYLTKNGRWNSPKYLMGESYGTPRSAVTSFMLHADGIDLNGITLISSILDYSKYGSPEGLFPSLAADAWYHNKTRGVIRQPLANYMDTVIDFAKNKYAPVVNNWQNTYNQFSNLITSNPSATLQKRINDIMKYAKNYQDVIDVLSKGSPEEVALSNTLTGLLNSLVTMNDSLATQAGNYIGIDASVIKSQTQYVYNQQPFSDITDFFLSNLLADKGQSIGVYDGRATGINTGIAKDIKDYLNKDPSTVNVNGAYTVAWNTYLNGDLKYTSTSAFQDLNEIISDVWDYSHIDPTGAQKGGGNTLYTAGDLGATMSMNPDLKVFQASGYFDSVTPFNQTNLDLAAMQIDPSIRKNISIHKYPSGHMIYLDGKSRTAMKADLSKFYDSTTHDPLMMNRILKLQEKTLELNSTSMKN